MSDASVGAPPGGSSDAAADAADESDWRDERAAIEAIVGEEKVRVLADGRGLAVAVEAEYAKQRLDAKRAAKALRISERESRRQRDVELGDPVDASEETEDASNEASPP